jgi:hypothetical protein
MFEPRCGVKSYISFGCGHARNEAQVTFYRCSLPEKHDGPHHDLGQGYTWPTEAMVEAEMFELRLRTSASVHPETEPK